ncbi:Leucyl-tRNA synthetase, mitochondrial [Myotisia sp. PD_48]|nr:Leucyl-tRNA synthetase, mitochondrial [Myotisia sp. PD_48]
MFPYPSGTLHMGHVRVYTISDVLARYKHMKGFDVLHPMGWDAFGLPAENAAIERGVDPAVWTEQNIANMKEQLKSLGIDFDWDRELTTCSPEFYKHTQRLFLLLYKKGLAYQAKAMVNYDPVDKTVLANEQVDANGCSWRSGAKVEQKELKQWFFRITAFKESLLKDLDTLSSGWPERILSMQRHWLGKSYGARVTFQVSTLDDTTDIDVFTTRPDTLHGVQYIALSITHPIVSKLAETTSELRDFIESAKLLPPETKAGYLLPGVNATNPLKSLEDNSYLPSSIPVYVAPYVLGDYGSGAVMGVPGHDSRDFAFWNENSPTEPAVYVIEPEPSSSDTKALSDGKKPWLGHGKTSGLCGSYSELPSIEAGKRIIADLKEKQNQADFMESWRLRDWLISRQRYWGAPIPIIHCDSCGTVPVPVDQLPVELPCIADRGLDKSGNPLESADEWKNTECPSCGKAAKRDTDTMDTFVDSSWYFLRFLDPFNEQLPFSPEVSRPVDIYIGGIEHAILHLLYSRFIYKFLASEGMVRDDSNSPEPFLKLLSQGMVHGKTYSDPSTGRFLRPSEVDTPTKSSPMLSGTQIKANVSFEKMSKSKYNGVDPASCIEKYGADATRAHILFSAPVSEVLEWDETKIVGIQRWFTRLWKLVSSTRESLSSAGFTVNPEGLTGCPINLSPIPPLNQLSAAESNLLLTTHNTICSVSRCLDENEYSLNTVISDLIKLTNAAIALPPSVSSSLAVTPSHAASYAVVTSLLRLLAPIAPAFSSECWVELHTGILQAQEATIPSIFSTSWPSEILSPSQIEYISKLRSKIVAVQVNGKTRFTVSVPQSESNGPEREQEWVLSHILESDQGKLWLRERNDWEKRKRVVHVGSGRVVNIVF